MILRRLILFKYHIYLQNCSKIICNTFLSFVLIIFTTQTYPFPSHANGVICIKKYFSHCLRLIHNCLKLKALSFKCFHSYIPTLLQSSNIFNLQFTAPLRICKVCVVNIYYNLICPQKRHFQSVLKCYIVHLGNYYLNM